MSKRRSGPTPTPAIERVLARIEIDDNGCWIWQGAKSKKGYGSIGIRIDGRKTTTSPHRVTYEALVGSIPDGLHLDHLCRVPSCCNPDHLEPVTPGENIRRGVHPLINGSWHAEKTHCPQGHLYDEANTRVYRGGRHCRACDRARSLTSSRTRARRAS